MLTFFWLLPLATALAPPVTIISGHLDHASTTQVQVGHGFNLLTQEYSHTATAQLDSQGNFRLVLPGLRAPSEASFRNGRESTTLFLSPGDNLRLTVNAASFDQTLRYTGSGAAANNYLALSIKSFDVGMANNPQRKIPISTPVQMRAATTAYRQQRLDFFARYAAQHPVPKVFRAYVRQSADFEQASTLLYYGNFHINHPAQYHNEPLPSGFDDFLVSLRPMQDSALAMHNQRYYSFLRMYGPLPAAEPLPTPAALLASTQAQFGASRSRDLVLARYVYNQFYDHDAAQLAPLLATFRQFNRDSSMARTLRVRYAQLLALSPGRPAPIFALLDHTGKKVALSDLRGKVVYLDFWGTWCAPCMAEMPVSLELRNKFAGREVAFVYVDVNDKDEKWQQALAAGQLLGPESVHLRSPDNAVPAAFQVEAYPSYWLIGRDGRILDAHAPRPSDGPKTVAAIEAALKN